MMYRRFLAETQRRGERGVVVSYLYFSFLKSQTEIMDLLGLG